MVVHSTKNEKTKVFTLKGNLNVKYSLQRVSFDIQNYQAPFR